MDKPDQIGRWNFLDRDMSIAGPVLKSIANDFEKKWSKSDFWVPPQTSEITDKTYQEFNQKFEGFIRHLHAIKNIKKTKSTSHSVEADYISDSYGSVKKMRTVHKHVLKAIQEASFEIAIFSPYVVLTSDIKMAIIAAKKRGVTVRIYTSKIGGSDEGLVNAAFLDEIDDLVKIGVELFLNDLKYVFHGKIIVTDRKNIIWGSYNLNSRSKLLDAENAIKFTSPELGEEILSDRGTRIFSRKTVTLLPQDYFSVHPTEINCRATLNTPSRIYKAPNSLKTRLLRNYI